MTKEQLEKEAKRLDLTAERFRKAGYAIVFQALRDAAGKLWAHAHATNPDGSTNEATHGS